MNSPSPRSAVQPQPETFLQEKNGTCVLSVGHKRANSGRLVYCGNLASLPPERVVPRFDYQYLHLVLPHQKPRNGWNCFSQILCSALCVLRCRRVSHYPFVALAAMHSGVACRVERD